MRSVTTTCPAGTSIGSRPAGANVLCLPVIFTSTRPPVSPGLASTSVRSSAVRDSPGTTSEVLGAADAPSQSMAGFLPGSS